MKDPPHPDTRTFPPDTLIQAVRSIQGELSVAMGSVDRVAKAAERIREVLPDTLPAEVCAQLAVLGPPLAKRGGSIAGPVVELLLSAAERACDPWMLLEGLLAARDVRTAERAVDRASELIASGKLAADTRVRRALANWAEEHPDTFERPEMLAGLQRIFASRVPAVAEAQTAPPDSALTDLFLHGATAAERRMAARILDADDRPPSEPLVEQLLGPEAHGFFANYLTYTRATHRDLLDIAPRPGEVPPALDSLRHAESLCGERLLRDVLSTVGWSRVNQGLRVERCVGVAVDGSFPVLMRPGEATLFDELPHAERAFDRFLFIAHGGGCGDEPGAGHDGDVARFRGYNLAHAEALAEIADIAPLTIDKARRILALLTRLVDDFTALFAAHEPECARLRDTFTALEAKVLAEMERTVSDEHVSAELTRLVQMFEDPLCLAEVQTLHGLKRYLHQKGLRLAFRLFESGRATNRTVDLVVTSAERVLQHAAPVHYIDFEPQGHASSRGLPGMPHSVAVVADALGRQMVHGRESVPSMDVFCYGNEVHYYLRYRNHPAFVRIDYSPPLRGGMIDLEYFGVSKYELSLHPDLNLDVIRRFFRALDFDVRINDTRIHARYDKERTLDLADLCDRIEALFCLSPYMMELDWIIGYLDLGEEARARVAAAWTEFFVRWRVLPIWQILTRDGKGIRLPFEPDRDDGREPTWSGQGPYRYRYRSTPPEGLLDGLRAALNRRHLDSLVLPESGDESLFGQVAMDHWLLRPLREAIARREVLETADGPVPNSPGRFQRGHEAEHFARLLDSGDAVLRDLSRVAGVAAALERSVRFRTTGTVNGYEVQTARLALRDGCLDLYVLRDGGGIIQLAFFGAGGCLHMYRDVEGEPWRGSWSRSATALATLLRQSNYLGPTTESSADSGRRPAQIRALFAEENPLRLPAPLPGDRFVEGVAAAPGRAVGTVLFGPQGHTPAEFEGAILMASAVRPEDNAYICQAAGIVSTGGGVLSHAGLLAVQFGKPAMIIPADWDADDGGMPFLRYRSVEHEREERQVGPYTVSMYRHLRERQDRIVEGDLVVLDADTGVVRILGRDRETLALHECVRQLGEVGERLEMSRGDAELLALRGRRLHARHQLEKLLGRMKSPVLARHAVRELLLSARWAAAGSTAAERSLLLCALMKNAYIGASAGEYVTDVLTDLARRHEESYRTARKLIPSSVDAYEILSLRSVVLRLEAALRGAEAALSHCSVESPPRWQSRADAIDRAAAGRLLDTRDRIIAEWLPLRDRSSEPSRLRHALRQIDRLDRLFAGGLDGRERDLLAALREELEHRDEDNLRACARRRVLEPSDGGFELHSLIGWKAANLAEVTRLGVADMIPEWFVVTDAAFRETLEAPVDRGVLAECTGGHGCSTLGEAIEHVMAEPDLTDAVRSARIAALWNGVGLPAPLAADVLAAYDRLAPSSGAGEVAAPAAQRPRPLLHGAMPGLTSDRWSDADPFVAVRSSAREEDTETAARAGEFETFLFVRGADALLEHLKRAWSGLWTERAIHNRRLMGMGPTQTGGGVLVQRIVWSRVSGVAQTVNLADGRMREMIVNAGLGLGAGIVSGVVAADQITIEKNADLESAPLRFRYVTSDKREQVVFNARSGVGTTLVETLYHQRLRPALEYVELCELARVAARLERAYGYPLDIEFGIEDTGLKLLQVRPVANFGAVFREAAERYPLDIASVLDGNSTGLGVNA